MDKIKLNKVVISLNLFVKVSQSMWDNFNSNVQSFECFSRKLQLKDAIHEMLKEIIPRK